MSPLLEEVLEAHGGFDRWQHFSRVEADAATGGGLFPLKGLMPDRGTRRMTVWLKEERVSNALQSRPSERLTSAHRSRRNVCRSRSWTARWLRNGAFPRNAFIGHGLSTAWRAEHRAYFDGYAMWTYLNTPFSSEMGWRRGQRGRTVA
jgi:hypothetical protein